MMQWKYLLCSLEAELSMSYFVCSFKYMAVLLHKATDPGEGAITRQTMLTA